MNPPVAHTADVFAGFVGNFSLIANLFDYSDDNECAQNTAGCVCGGTAGTTCTTSCTNTPGGYTCGCSLGHAIDVLGLSCEGKCSGALLVY